jgi:flagellar basal body rod protein FlgC
MKRSAIEGGYVQTVNVWLMRRFLDSASQHRGYANGLKM